MHKVFILFSVIEETVRERNFMTVSYHSYRDTLSLLQKTIKHKCVSDALPQNTFYGQRNRDPI